MNISYYNNLTYDFILTGRLEEAFNALEEIFNERDFDIHKHLSIMDTIATFEFYKGNFEKSQKLFEEIISAQSKNKPVTCLYFFSQIYIKNGNTIEAINLLKNIDMSKVEY